MDIYIVYVYNITINIYIYIYIYMCVCRAPRIVASLTGVAICLVH